jgi:hypothetical protein
MIKISYDEQKREKTLIERGLDFRDALFVFSGEIFEFEDMRTNYGERRMIVVGHLFARMVIIGYVQRNEYRHIFSMRKANEREIKHYQQQFEAE